MSNLRITSNHCSVFQSATTREVEQQDSPQPVVQETLNPFHKSVTGSTITPAFMLTAATSLTMTAFKLQFCATSTMRPIVIQIRRVCRIKLR